MARKQATHTHPYNARQQAEIKRLMALGRPLRVIREAGYPKLSYYTAQAISAGSYGKRLMDGIVAKADRLSREDLAHLVEVLSGKLEASGKGR